MSDSVLASAQAEAQVEASRFFGDEPVQTWSPSTPWLPTLKRRARVLGWVAAACCVLAAAIGGLGWAVLHQTPIEEPALDDVVDNFETEAPVAPRRTTASTTTAPSPTLNITRQGAKWHIEALGVSRLQVAQRLSQVSGSPLSGDLSSLAATRPMQLSWQGRGAAAAWQAVLGHEVSFATQCSTRRCRVWLAGSGAPGSSPIAPITASVAAPVITPPPMPATMAAAPPQSDSDDPRIAAHHD